MANEYKTHSFKRSWHDRVEEFIEKNEDLAFDSPKYFIKFCVNRYMDEHSDSDPTLNDLIEVLNEMDDEHIDELREAL